MENPFIEISGDISISPFNANPISGYETPKNFPNCCERHKHAFEEAQRWFDKFPNCCKPHKEIAKKYWFDWWIKQNDYSTIAQKIVRQISYTDHVISEKVNTENWYKSIVDYIDYCVSSFGRPAFGLHIYLSDVMHQITHNTKIPDTKRKSLLDFVAQFYQEPNDTKSKADFNILYQAYQDWVEAFPFEINSYFGNLKQQYEKQLPIVDGMPEINLYTGVSKVKILSKERLFHSLIDLTSDLIKKVNGLTLYEQGLLVDTDKIRLELIIAERKRKIEQGYKYNSPDETTQYKKMIQYWLNDEKRFIAEISPLINAPTLPNKTQEEKLSVSQIALIYVYEGKSITRENGKEIANKYGYYSVQNLFQKFTYYSSVANRKGRPTPYTPKKIKNKIELLQSVLPHLTKEAKKRATDEIQTLKQSTKDEE